MKKSGSNSRNLRGEIDNLMLDKTGCRQEIEICLTGSWPQQGVDSVFSVSVPLTGTFGYPLTSVSPLCFD